MLVTCYNPVDLKAEDKIAVTKGQKIAFLGDSVTAAGASKGGYCAERPRLESHFLLRWHQRSQIESDVGSFRERRSQSQTRLDDPFLWCE